MKVLLYEKAYQALAKNLSMYVYAMDLGSNFFLKLESYNGTTHQISHSYNLKHIDLYVCVFLKSNSFYFGVIFWNIFLQFQDGFENSVTVLCYV